jgi:hypothetical protein
MATVNSARSNFRDVVAIAAAGTGALTALANVQVTVRLPGTVNPATIYGSRNPADLTPLANPLTTDATGIISFWAEVGEYDLFFHDTIAPARIADQTIGWSSISPIDKGIPALKIRDDAAMSFTSLAADAMRQFAPLGTVLDWWRPSSTWDAGAGAGNPPPGFEIADGRTLAVGQHDFGASPLVLPDLRNKFILGANPANGDGTVVASADETPAQAPGIRGSSGFHRITLDTTMIPSHQHRVNGTTGNSNQNIDHTHGGTTGTENQSLFHDHGLNYMINQGTSGTGNTAITTSDSQPKGRFPTRGDGPQAHNHTFGTGFGSVNVTNHNHTMDFQSGNAGGGLAHENRPSYYGLLKIIKVRRA